MTGYKLYQLAFSIKLHFSNKSYNIVKYNGKSFQHITFENYEKLAFHKLYDSIAKYIPNDKAIAFFTAQFIDNDNFSLANINLIECAKIYKSWKIRIDNIYDNFIKDLNYIQTKINRWQDLFFNELLYTFVIQKTISKETFALLLTDIFFEYANKEDLLQNEYMKYTKYRLLLSMPKDLVISTFNENNKLNKYIIKDKAKQKPKKEEKPPVIDIIQFL